MPVTGSFYHGGRFMPIARQRIALFTHRNQMKAMSMKASWLAPSRNPVVRHCLVVLGFLLIALTPVVGPIPGPGGVLVFAAGLSLILKYTGWAKRLYVRFKRKHPKKGSWADWSLRRASHRRREEMRRRAEADVPLD
jgi:hypothetical protein